MNFLNSFSIRPNQTPILQQSEGVVLPLSDDEISDSDGESSVEYHSEVEMLVDASSGGRSADIQLRKAATATQITDIDWKCNHPCKGENCFHRHGFLPFVIDLRNRFWGPTGSAAPTSKQRRLKLRKSCRKFIREGTRLCLGMPSPLMGKGSSSISETVEQKGRAKFKLEKVIALITLFLATCEMPPSHGMQHIKILPFPNIGHFYQEYCSTFKAPYLAIMSTEQATR
jgi:hypothetical protein